MQAPDVTFIQDHFGPLTMDNLRAGYQDHTIEQQSKKTNPSKKIKINDGPSVLINPSIGVFTSNYKDRFIKREIKVTPAGYKMGYKLDHAIISESRAVSKNKGSPKGSKHKQKLAAKAAENITPITHVINSTIEQVRSSDAQCVAQVCNIEESNLNMNPKNI